MPNVPKEERIAADELRNDDNSDTMRPGRPDLMARPSQSVGRNAVISSKKADQAQSPKMRENQFSVAISKNYAAQDSNL